MGFRLPDPFRENDYGDLATPGTDTTTARIDYGENTRKYQRLVEMSLSTAWVPNTIDGRTEKESSPVFLQAIVTIRLPANCNKTGLLSFSRSLRSRLV